MKVAKRTRWVLLVLGAVLVPFGLAAPASAAASKSCSVRSPTTSCKAGNVRANSLHQINYSMCTSASHYTDWQVKDADNGTILRQGRLQPPFDCASGTISGLYGQYYGWVFNTRSGASASIWN